MPVRKTLKRINSKTSIKRRRTRSRKKRSQRKMRSKKPKKGGFVSLKQMIRSGSTQSFMPNKK